MNASGMFYLKNVCQDRIPFSYHVGPRAKTGAEATMHLQNTTSQPGDETLERKPMTKLLHAASQKTNWASQNAFAKTRQSRKYIMQGFTSVPLLSVLQFFPPLSKSHHYVLVEDVLNVVFSLLSKCLDTSKIQQQFTAAAP